MSLPAGAAVNGEDAMVTVLFIDLRDFKGKTEPVAVYAPAAA
jgi:hypothetical protein